MTLIVLGMTQEVSHTETLLFIEMCCLLLVSSHYYEGVSSGDEPLESKTATHRAGGKRKQIENETKQPSKKKRLSQEENLPEKRIFCADKAESDIDAVGDGGESGEEEEEERESDGYIDDSGDSEQDTGEEVEAEGEEAEEGGEKSVEKDVHYLPPHLRGPGRNPQQTPALERLQRTIQGLVNRYTYGTQ